MRVAAAACLPPQAKEAQVRSLQEQIKTEEGEKKKGGFGGFKLW